MNVCTNLDSSGILMWDIVLVKWIIKNIPQVFGYNARITHSDKRNKCLSITSTTDLELFPWILWQVYKWLKSKSTTFISVSFTNWFWICCLRSETIFLNCLFLGIKSCEVWLLTSVFNIVKKTLTHLISSAAQGRKL